MSDIELAEAARRAVRAIVIRTRDRAAADGECCYGCPTCDDSEHAESDFDFSDDQADRVVRDMEYAVREFPESIAVQAIRRGVSELIEMDLGAEFDEFDFTDGLRRSRHAQEPAVR